MRRQVVRLRERRATQRLESGALAGRVREQAERRGAMQQLSAWLTRLDALRRAAAAAPSATLRAHCHRSLDADAPAPLHSAGLVLRDLRRRSALLRSCQHTSRAADAALAHIDAH
jgi:hypothetical protein